MLGYFQALNFAEKSQRLRNWFDSSGGVSILKAEQRSLDCTLQRIFGYYACQVSVAEGLDMLDNCPVGYHFSLIDTPTESNCLSAIACDANFWPINPGSLDLILLHHVLDIADSPHRLLIEAAKSIMPEGKLVVLGFNPCSLSGVGSWLIPERIKAFKGVKFINTRRLRDWLNLLGFNIEQITYGSYVNPLGSFFKKDSEEVIEKHCAQWRLPFGSFYSILATKEAHCMTSVRQSWLKVGNNMMGQPVARSRANCFGENIESAR
ncbi:MAG: hypothetical protein QS721_13585 [Candidatus Endonucleobacter sp. (ex Gigantidas childressi)]|nr:hypothetical protein [Candidatus Endonucleobacter sp. (ex Gigantidas childressi)]